MTNEAYVWHKNAKVEILRGVPLYWYLEKIIMQRKQRLIFKVHCQLCASKLSCGEIRGLRCV